MWRFFFLGFACLATAVPAFADSPWQTVRDHTVRLADFPEGVSFDGPRGDRRISVEELDAWSDGHKLRFTLLEGPGNRAPIEAYVDVTVRTGPNGNVITLDMMQSFGTPGGGTMSDLCRAMARHPDIRRAVEVKAVLDMTNDKAFKAALREPGARPETAFLSTRNERTAVPLAKHVRLLFDADYRVESLSEQTDLEVPRYELRATPLRIVPRVGTSTSDSCIMLLDVAG